MAWNNSKMRSGEGIGNINAHIQGFIKDQDAKLSKFALEAKRPETRTNRSKEKNEILRFWRDPKTLKNLQITYQINNLIVQAKLMIVRKLEQVQDIGTFLKTDKGFRVTKAEGFVSIDHLTGGAVKLVDRLEFSHANMNIAKDWKK